MKKYVGILLVICLMAQCLCGCSVGETILGSGDLNPEEFEKLNPEGGFERLVLIGGYHANAIKPTEDDIRAKLEPLLEKAISYRYDEENSDFCATIHLDMIVADGDPEIVTLVDYYQDKAWEIEMELSAESSDLLLMDLEDTINNIYAAVSSDRVRADDSEVDLHAALRIARNLLREDKNTKGNILIFDNGVVTDGYLNMNALPIEQMTNEDVGKMVAELSDSSVIDLEGINVEFYGIANTCGAQTSVKEDPIVADALVKFWTEYLVNRCKATLPYDLVVCEWVGTKLNCNEDGEDTYPEVTNVPFKLAPLPVGENGEGGETGSKGSGVIVLNTAALKFKGDSDKFRDQEIAEKTLLSYEETFETLKSNKITIYVVGSKAKTGPDDDVKDDKLSADRAKAVKKLICDVYDIPEDQVITIDAGTQTFSWRNAVEFPDGKWKNLDSNAQQENRVVAIIPATAEEVVELIQAGELPEA